MSEIRRARIIPVLLAAIALVQSGVSAFANDHESPNEPNLPSGPNTDKYASQRKLYNDASHQIVKLLKEGKKDEAEDLTANLRKQIEAHRVDVLDPWPGRVDDFEQAVAIYNSDFSIQLIEDAKQQAAQTGDFFGSLLFEDISRDSNNQNGSATADTNQLMNLAGSDNAVKVQMRLLQAAVEKYAKKHGGKYPIKPDEVF